MFKELTYQAANCPFEYQNVYIIEKFYLSLNSMSRCYAHESMSSISLNADQ